MASIPSTKDCEKCIKDYLTREGFSTDLKILERANLTMESIPFERNCLNMLMMDYFIREGFIDTAELMMEESGVQPPLDLSTIGNRSQIGEAVKKGLTEEALDLISEHYPGLLEPHNHIHFLLKQLHFIELIRARKVEESVTYARTVLFKVCDGNQEMLNELEYTMALLAFENPERSPFGNLMEQKHRYKVANELNAALFRVTHKERASEGSMLMNIIKLIYWSNANLNKVAAK